MALLDANAAQVRLRWTDPRRGARHFVASLQVANTSTDLVAERHAARFARLSTRVSPLISWRLLDCSTADRLARLLCPVASTDTANAPPSSDDVSAAPSLDDIHLVSDGDDSDTGQSSFKLKRSILSVTRNRLRSPHRFLQSCQPAQVGAPRSARHAGDHRAPEHPHALTLPPDGMRGASVRCAGVTR